MKSQIATSNKAVTHEILFMHLSIKKRQMELTVIIQSKIYEIRGQQVMFDFDLAALYQVETRILNQSVKRNIKRFPEDFMFQLTVEEW